MLSEGSPKSVPLSSLEMSDDDVGATAVEEGMDEVKDDCFASLRVAISGNRITRTENLSTYIELL